MKWPQICSFLLLTSSVSCEIFSSTIDIIKLLDTETTFIHTLQSFILKAEQKIMDVKRKIERYNQENEMASKNITDFVSNPLNSFILVKRLLTEWKIAENLFSNFTSQEVMRNMTHIKESKYFPTEVDFNGTIKSLDRIRRTYNLNLSSLADGKIYGIQFSSQLSASDCFLIGQKLFESGYFHNCILWMTEALNRQERESDMTETSRWEILEYIASSAFKLGDLPKALLFTDELLNICPDHPRASLNRETYVNELKKVNGTSEQKENKQRNILEDNIYEMACRKEISPPIRITSKLKCRYVTNDIPFLRLAPMKEEEVYLNPRIVLFREILYDSEIEIMENLALPKLITATVRDEVKNTDVPSEYRVSKHAWLDDEEHPVVTTVVRRIEDMTKLSLDTAEKIQVVNYGTGGFYVKHTDYFEPNNKTMFDGTGNRIATLLFYMNGVAQGGATVFPELHLGVWPEKGTAILWHNLLPDGQPDKRTLHAGCPVVIGTKWIGTKWFHERGQEFKRPCDLKPSNVLRKKSNNGTTTTKQQQ